MLVGLLAASLVTTSSSNDTVYDNKTRLFSNIRRSLDVPTTLDNSPRTIDSPTVEKDNLPRSRRDDGKTMCYFSRNKKPIEIVEVSKIGHGFILFH